MQVIVDISWLISKMGLSDFRTTCVFAISNLTSICTGIDVFNTVQAKCCVRYEISRLPKSHCLLCVREDTGNRLIISS